MVICESIKNSSAVKKQELDFVSVKPPGTPIDSHRSTGVGLARKNKHQQMKFERREG